MILGRGAEITRLTDVAVLLGLLMDHCDLTEFGFSVKDMVDSRGAVDIDYNIDDMSYTIYRTKDNPADQSTTRFVFGKKTSELSPRELHRARYGGPRGGSPQIGRD